MDKASRERMEKRRALSHEQWDHYQAMYELRESSRKFDNWLALGLGIVILMAVSLAIWASS